MLILLAVEADLGTQCRAMDVKDLTKRYGPHLLGQMKTTLTSL